MSKFIVKEVLSYNNTLFSLCTTYAWTETIWSCLTEDGLILASVDHTDDVHDEDGLGILNNGM